MDIEQVFNYLAERIRDCQDHGYIITGQLDIVKPMVPGQVTVDAEGIKSSEQHGRLELTVIKVVVLKEVLDKELTSKVNKALEQLPEYEKAKLIVAAFGSSSTCPVCGMVLVRTGSCYTCPGCAWNGGCG